MRETVLFFASGLMAGGIISFFAALYMLVRNNWVYRTRVGLIDTNYAAYKRLPTYDEMMRRFWVWNVKAFLRGQ